VAVNTTHPDYDVYAPKWKRVRDCIAGQDAIHAARTEYLPKLKDESDGTGLTGSLDDNAYGARLKRSDFFNGTWRTIAGLGGMAFRKPPTVEVPPAIGAYLDDVTMSGVALDALAMDTLDEVLGVGRIGILVDYPQQQTNIVPLTVDAAARQGLRPMLQLYPAESIINWKFGRVANAWVLTQVVLKECELVEEDEFKSKAEDRWRVLDLDVAGEYRQRLFKREKDKDVQIGSDVYPLMNGKKLTQIPFVIIGPDGKGDKIDEPPLIDLVDANLALYQINADYRHALHWSGLPTLFLAGLDSDPDKKYYIGSAAAITATHPDAKASFIEFSGQGLNPLKQARDDKKLEMAMLGARMIADETSHAKETLGATQIKRQGENGVLSRIAQAVSEGLEWALGIFAEWAGHPGEVVYQINRDFQPTLIDAPTLTALTASLQAGAISEEEFFDLLQRGDMVKPEVSFDDHKEQIASAAPPAPVKPNPKAAAA
jgi:hypothetical protein